VQKFRGKNKRKKTAFHLPKKSLAEKGRKTPILLPSIPSVPQKA